MLVSRTEVSCGSALYDNACKMRLCVKREGRLVVRPTHLCMSSASVHSMCVATLSTHLCISSAIVNEVASPASPVEPACTLFITVLLPPCVHT